MDLYAKSGKFFFDFKGKAVEVDVHSHLKRREEWNEDLAYFLASDEKIELTEDHWEIIRLVRENFSEKLHSLKLSDLRNLARTKLGPERGDLLRLWRLFPGGPSRQSYRIAGLPRASG